MLNSFSKQIDNFIGKTFYKVEVFYRELCQELTKIMVYRTPIDTGAAQANWQVGINRPDWKNTDAPNKNMIMVSEEKMKLLDDVKITDTVWITNSMAYILHLEKGLYGDGPKTRDGYSLQAPAGMVSVTFAELRMHLQKAVAVAEMESKAWSPNLFSNVRRRYNALF